MFLRQALIWIVDDDPTEASLAERTLGDGYAFETFPSGEAVVEHLASGASQPDLVLLAWAMAKMSGEEVCRRLRADPRTVELPIILIASSRTDTGEVTKGLTSGANDYIARPFFAEELHARVDSVIRVRQLAEAAQLAGRRLATINLLGRALMDAGTDIPRILDELARCLTVSLCDACSIELSPTGAANALRCHGRGPSSESLAAIATSVDPSLHAFATKSEAAATLPASYAPYIERFGLRGHGVLPLSRRVPGRGTLTVTRDGSSEPFDAADLATIATCIEYASLAIEAAWRFDAERAAERAVDAERQRIAQFQQEMLGIVGHDLRTPIGAILFGAELLADSRRGDVADTNVIKRIESSAWRMMRMVEQLLDMTRARLGAGISVVPKRIMLQPVLRSVIDEVMLAHAGTRIDLRGATDAIGVWDPDRLGQVASNLLSNAVQYGRPGSPIVVHVARSDGNTTLTFHNQHRGAPIAPELLGRMFEPYLRGDGAPRNGNGLGLGLYIVSEIVRAHHGTIDVHSSQDGTTFRVVLPETGVAPRSPGAYVD